MENMNGINEIIKSDEDIKNANGISICDEEREKIQLLRERVSDILEPEKYENDLYLRKWLIARSFDVEKAEDMLKKHVRFMKVNGLDKIDENYVPPEVSKYFLTTMLGYDNEGSIVRILHLGGSDIKGLALSMSKLDSMKVAVYTIKSDLLRQKRERVNGLPLCDKQVYILDLQGLSWKSVIHTTVVERAFMLLKTYEANYPESLKVAYLVNAPSFFSFIYNWLKSFLPESILSKVEILSPDEVPAALTKKIDPSILPACLGGTKIDPDGNPECPSLYEKPMGATIPENMMLTNQFHLLKEDKSAEKTVVENRSAFRIENLITEPNSILKWDFQTTQYDIRVGLNYKPDKASEFEEIIPLHRVESHRIPESGSFSCQNAGIYEIVFDNTYSWINKKELIYKITLSLPE
ncbi:SEC14-like protein 4, partial [Stegodyphus mimosarum]